MKQLLSPGRGQPFRVREPFRDAPTEDDRSSHHGPGPRTAAGLVHSGDQPAYFSLHVIWTAVDHVVESSADASASVVPTSSSCSPSSSASRWVAVGGRSSVKRPRRPERKSDKTTPAARSQSGVPPGSRQ